MALEHSVVEDIIRELDGMMEQVQSDVRSLEDHERARLEQDSDPHVKQIEEQFQNLERLVEGIHHHLELWEKLSQNSQQTTAAVPPPPVQTRAMPTTKELLKVPGSHDQRRGPLKRLADSNSSVLSSDSGYRSRDASASDLLGTESRVRELGVDFGKNDGVLVEEKGDDEEEVCTRLTEDLDGAMVQVHRHIRELEDTERALTEQHPDLHLKKIERMCQRVETQLNELRQEMKTWKGPPRSPPPQLCLLLPPFIPIHTLPSPERPPQEQKLRDVIQANLPCFVSYTNLELCMAHLIANRVISDQTANYLMFRGQTHKQNNMLFYTSVLPSAGNNAYSRLHVCLRATTAEQPGHEDLVKLLDKAI